MDGQVRGSKVGITLVVMIAALMAFIDISIVNVALSDIRASFGTPLDQIGWVSTGYMMANILVIPLTGWLQRRFGYRRSFAYSIILFTIASALCGAAWNLPSLVLFRILQGLGGGAVIPTAQSLMFARYPRSEHGIAAGLYGLGAITGPLLGPTIGGYLISWASWHWIFLVNVPFGIIAVVLAFTVIKEPGFVPDRSRIDRFGIVLLAIGMPALQYVLEEGNRHGWFDSAEILLLTAVAVISLVTFVIHELETPNPVVDLRVFSNRSYAAGTGINFLTGLALFGSTYLFSLFCGTVLRYSALDIGRVFLVAGVAQIILMPLVGKISPKLDPRYFLFLGVAVLALSQWIAGSLTDQAGFGNLVELQVIRSVGLAFIFIPVSVAALSDISPSQRGNATGLFNLTRELGGSLGTAWMGKVIADGMAHHGSRLAEHISLYDPGVQEQLAGWARRGLPAEAMLQRKVEAQSMVLSFEGGFQWTTLAILTGIVLVFFLKRPKPGTEAAVGAH